MFRLDRKAIGTPCDLCIHNTSSHGMLGLQLYADQKCAFNTGDPLAMMEINRTKGSFTTNLTCKHFELNIDALEKVVYKRSGFAISHGTVGMINMDGQLNTAYDPMWIVISSYKAFLRSDNLQKKRALCELLSDMQRAYPSRYRDKSDEDKCILASAYWVVVSDNLKFSRLNANGQKAYFEQLSSERKFETLHEVIGALCIFGHPDFHFDTPDYKPQADSLKPLVERVYAEMDDLAKRADLVDIDPATK